MNATANWIHFFLIADGSTRITVTMRATFPECSRGVCWAHVPRNMDKKLLGVSNEERRKMFKRDLHLS